MNTITGDTDWNPQSFLVNGIAFETDHELPHMMALNIIINLQALKAQLVHFCSVTGALEEAELINVSVETMKLALEAVLGFDYDDHGGENIHESQNFFARLQRYVLALYPGPELLLQQVPLCLQAKFIKAKSLLMPYLCRVLNVFAITQNQRFGTDYEESTVVLHPLVLQGYLIPFQADED